MKSDKVTNAEQPAKKIKVMEIPGRIIETKEIIETEIKKNTKGVIMKALIKFIFKLIWKVIVLGVSMIGVVYALNKFAPEVFDSLTDWLKEQRDD